MKSFLTMLFFSKQLLFCHTNPAATELVDTEHNSCFMTAG